MSVRRFVVHFDEFPLDRALVKRGSNPQNVVTACQCINVGLFVSQDLRRDVEVCILYDSEEGLVGMVFSGHSLRRVSPDERSISFFLLKATEVAHHLDSGEQETLNNGIIVFKTDHRGLCDAWKRDDLYLAVRRNCEREDVHSLNLAHGTFVVLAHDSLQTALRGMGTVRTIDWGHSPEKLILEINWRADRNSRAASEIS